MNHEITPELTGARLFSLYGLAVRYDLRQDGFAFGRG